MYSFMASESKEDQLLSIILENSPLQHWHFEELVKASNLTRSATNKWLKRYVTQGVLKKIQEPGKFPYFTVGASNATYLARKRLYALEKLYSSGLIEHLLTLKNAKTIIIFGSIARGDWYKGSDIDLFIFGDADDFDKRHYEKQIGRHIELHEFSSKKELESIKNGLIKNVMNGYVVKGDITELSA